MRDLYLAIAVFGVFKIGAFSYHAIQNYPPQTPRLLKPVVYWLGSSHPPSLKLMKLRGHPASTESLQAWLKQSFSLNCSRALFYQIMPLATCMPVSISQVWTYLSGHEPAESNEDGEEGGSELHFGRVCMVLTGNR